MPSLIIDLLALDPGATLLERADGAWLDAPSLDVLAMARRMAADEATLSTITAIARAEGETDLVYHYRKGPDAVNIKTRTSGNTIASITPVSPAAGWIEREIHDLYAVEFSGHPNLARLIRPQELAPGFFREPGGRQSSKS